MSVLSIRRTTRVGLFCTLLSASIGAAELHIPEAQAKHSATSKPAPAISPMARNLKVSGRVEVDVAIDETGSVTDVKATQGPPVLSISVVEAVHKWKFTPFTDPGGSPSKAVTTLTFDFKQ